jgi:hypothetical protein
VLRADHRDLGSACSTVRRWRRLVLVDEDMNGML